MTKSSFRHTPFLNLFAAILLIGLTGCQTPNIHITDNYGYQNNVQTLALDAKQRVVVFAKRSDHQTVTCAEPSPDALSALSSSLGGNLQNNKEAVASFASAMTESAASIGLRTQSIQLLRDGMYRSCEAYAAGAIEADDYNRQQRRYQNLMLSLLAIEQITGAVVARQVGLGDGRSSASVGENANEAAASATKEDQKVEVAQQDADAAKGALTADKIASAKKACDAAQNDASDANCKKIKDYDAKIEETTAALETAKKIKETAHIALDAARAAVRAAAAGATVKFGEDTQTSKVSDTSAKYVSEAARTIVSTTLLASFAQEECSRVWDIFSPKKINPDTIQGILLSANISAATVAATVAAIKPKFQAKGIESSQAFVTTLYSIRSEDTTNTIQLTDEQIKSVGATLDKITSPQIASVLVGVPDEQKADLIKSLFHSCLAKGGVLDNPALYIPQFYKPVTAFPLKVLGADSKISMTEKNEFHDFIILGGTQPYRLNNSEKKVEAMIVEKTNTLHVTIAQSPENDDKTTLSVVDANDSHVDITILLKKSSKK